MRGKKAWLLTLLVVVLLSLVLSLFYVAVEGDHLCSGTDCPVCAEISSFIGRMGAAAAAVVLLSFPVWSEAVSFGDRQEYVILPLATLVTQKIKLSS